MPHLGAQGGLAAEIKEITRGSAAIQSFFGRGPGPIFRPPFGSWNALTLQAAKAAGFPQVITWSIDSGDSEGPELPVRQLLANVACAGSGDIILMHANRRSSAAALPLVIKLLRQKGLQFVDISTLLASGRPVYSDNPADMRRRYTCRMPQKTAPPQAAPVSRH
jgi:peptidoglycan/xylan/chitin deacetylase (PgdA/CDA1 family)